jgi:hypothetical protein
MHQLLNKWRKKNGTIPEGNYLVIEVITSKCNEHTHRKGTKGGQRVTIHPDLHKLEEIKKYLTEAAAKQTGPFQQMFTKAIAPIV